MLFHLLFLTLSNQAQAVPLQITQQGRILDNNGTTVVGVHDVTFRMYDTKNSGSPLWSETLVISFNNGYYAAILGTDESGNPLDSSVLGLYPLYLELQLDSNTPMTPRQEITSVPYAQMAGVAESVDGGTVNASEVQIGSVPVIDGNRNWVGEPITVDWSQVQSIPSDLQDGDNDTQLSEGEVENFVTNGSLSLHEDTTLNGEQILTLGMDSDTLADISCSDGDVPKWDAVVGQWDCGLDNDTLANLNCSAGELAKFDGTNWSCGEDIDTVLDADTVISYVEQNSLSIPAGSQIDGADILTSADTLEPEWTDIQNRPNGLDDGDDDTQLSQSEVIGYVESSSVNLANGSQVNNRKIIGQPSVCGASQVLVYNATSNDWECGNDTDTTLTESEMKTMIEAMTINFQNRPQVNGEEVLTENSVISPSQIDAGGSTIGQVLVSDGTTLQWSDVVSNYECTEKPFYRSIGGFYLVVDCGTYSYISRDGGPINYWTGEDRCTTTPLEYSNDGIISYIDCGTYSSIVKGEYQSNYIASSIFSPNGGTNSVFCGLDTQGGITCFAGGGYDQDTDVPSGTFTDINISPYGCICALDELGQISCWGRDDYGQVSNAPSDSGYTQVAVGTNHACAIDSNGSVSCWGQEYAGEVSNIPSDLFSSLHLGSYVSCGIRIDESIICWGRDNHGTISNVPTGSFKSMNLNFYTACGIKTDDTLHCWGLDALGMVSDAPSGTFISVDNSDYATCAIETNGNIQCWGSNHNDQLDSIPQGNFSQISVSKQHTCALEDNGSIHCWGKDSSGSVEDVPEGVFTSVKTSIYTSCGMLNSGNVVCWGQHSNTVP